MPSPKLAGAAALLLATGNASTSVVAARMSAFSEPATMLSPWHRTELMRMGFEKIGAIGAGVQAASTELASLPFRLWAIGARPSSWTATGSLDAWAESAGLWIGVGNAALRPAMTAAMRNRSRLARRAVA